MPLPDVTVTIQDGALGLLPPSTDQDTAVIGVCSLGTAETLYAFSDLQTLSDTLGVGPAAEAAALRLAVAGGTVYVVPATITTDGSVGSVTFDGSGNDGVTFPTKTAVVASGTTPPTVTLTGTPTGVFDFIVDITTGGALATAVFKYSTDGGETYTEDVTTAATVLMTGTGVTLNFAAGTYNTDNLYQAATSLPWDSYEIAVEVVTGGALGDMTYRYSLDADNPGGPTWSATLSTASTQRFYRIPNSGLAISFSAGTYVAEDSWTAQAVAPSYSTDELTDAFDVLTADPREWSCVHVVGQAANVAGSHTVASLLNTSLTTVAENYRFSFGIVEVADDTDANIISEFEDYSGVWVCLATRFAYTLSVLTGRVHRRSSAWITHARVGKTTIAQELGEIATGALEAIVELDGDEQITPGLDATGFTTLRSVIGRTGSYITNGRIAAGAGSDFQFITNRRVMNRAAKVARDALLNFVNSRVRVNANGTIFELDARRIEAALKSALNSALTQPGHASAVSATVSRTNNVLSTQELLVTVRVRPLGYARYISLDIGFENPALQVAA